MCPAKSKKSQRDRFIEAAKKVGADRSGKAFERVVKKIVKPRPPRNSWG